MLATTIAVTEGMANWVHHLSVGMVFAVVTNHRSNAPAIQSAVRAKPEG